MKKRLLCALFLTAGLATASVQAEDAFDLDHLKQLFNNYQRQQAYDYASRYLGEMEGDSNFDYLYGVAAIDAGRASQGVFALERVLMQFPDDQVARLELARGYFILEEYARSRQEFEKVLATNPPRGVKDTTETFLEKIRISEARYRTTTGGNVTLGLGSDSNVNSGPDDSSLTLIQLDDSSLGHSDTFTELTASWGVGYPFAPGWMATGNITAALLRNQTYNEFDTTTGTVLAGVSRVFKQSRYKGELMYQQFQLDGDEYRSLNGLNLGWQYNFSQTTSLDTTLQYATLEFPTVEVKNSTLTTLAFTYTHNLDGALQPVLFANLNIGSEAADDSSNASALSDTERDILGLRLGTILAFSSKLALQMAAGIQTSDYAEPQVLSFLGDIRQDNYISANLNLIWLIDKAWRLDTKLGYSKNDSNVELYSYDRTTIGLEANYAF
jgi:hypothetical protein